jgi:hypothetical protein
MGIGFRGSDAFGKPELINPNFSGNFYVQLGTAYSALVI